MPLPRIHAVELHERPGCPALFRRIATDYLRTVGEVFGAFEPVAPVLARALERHGARRIIDLCSGGGGPTIKLAESIQARLGFAPEVVLTDLYPNLEAFAWSRARALVPVSFARSRVDALAVPEHLHGVRTVFDAFHHFRPAQARAMLADAARKRAPLLVVEATERSFPAMIGMLLFVPLFVLLLTPFVRPFSWGRLLFTYVIPVAVPLIVFDGIVSCLRSYTPEELRAMTKDLEAADFRCEIGRLPSRGGTLTYLLGMPETAL
jgi:SAM-dependent methyltransferase